MLLCLQSSFSFYRSFNELRIKRIPPNPHVLSFHLCLCLPFVWLVSIPIIARFNDHWVTSEIESTWQPESARTASWVQISHPGEVLLSRNDDRSMKWTGEWCTGSVCLSQVGITNTPECVWPCFRECMCISVCFYIMLYKKTGQINQTVFFCCPLLFGRSWTASKKKKIRSHIEVG